MKVKRLTVLHFLIFFIIKQTSISYGSAFLYPVASTSDDSVYLICQRSSPYIELWLYNCLTKEAIPGLLSRFRPAGLRLLPGKSGFSFVDNGIVKVKLFHKRSPKSLEVSEPIYDINTIEWADSDHCYFSAKLQDHYGIFQLSLDAQLDCIISSENADFMYPQKAGKNLFFIERSIKRRKYCYRILKSKYFHESSSNEILIKKRSDNENIFSNSFHFEKNLKTRAQEDTQVILDLGSRPVAFLSMMSSKEGFVLEYQPFIVKGKDTVMSFSYHRIYQEQNEWKMRKLFDFKITTNFLFFDSECRLYEHMLPLLPKKIGDYLYYSDCSTSQSIPVDEVNTDNLIAMSCYEGFNLNMYRYHLGSETTEQLTFASSEGEHYFCPLLVGNHVYCGSFLQDEPSMDKVVLLAINHPN